MFEVLTYTLLTRRTRDWRIAAGSDARPELEPESLGGSDECDTESEHKSDEAHGHDFYSTLFGD
jgi:hypothetical protein